MTVSTGSQLDTLVKREREGERRPVNLKHDCSSSVRTSDKRRIKVSGERGSTQKEREKKINVRHTKNSKAQLCTGVKMSDRESPAAALILLFLPLSLSWPSERINRRKHPSCVRSTRREREKKLLCPKNLSPRCTMRVTREASRGKKKKKKKTE